MVLLLYKITDYFTRVLYFESANAGLQESIEGHFLKALTLICVMICSLTPHMTTEKVFIYL